MTYRTNHNLTKRCSCGRRQWIACPHAWRFNLQVGGRNVRGSTGLADRDKAEIRVAEIRAALRAGTYAPPRRAQAPQPGAELTFGTAFGRYIEQRVEPHLSDKSLESHRGDERFLARATVPSGATFAELALARVTIEDVEAAKHARQQRVSEQVTRKGKTWMRTAGGDVAANRMLAHLAAFWCWAIHPKRALAIASPFNLGGRVPEELRKSKEENRDRRLRPGEEQALLDAAGPHLRDLIVAALETGARKHELLSLRWHDVRWLQNEIALASENTKTKRARQIPISKTLRELLVRRLAAHPKDHPWKPEHHVFGDAIGGQVGEIQVAWRRTVLRAHGVKVVRAATGGLSAESRAQLREIDLHFHDLRHEAGSRKLESGWPLHAVSRWLGHTNITTTDTYLNATDQLLHELNDRRQALAR